jgi:hypothetical protein
MMDDLYKLPADAVFSELKKLVGQTVYTPVQKQIQPEDPRMAYLAWGNAVIKYNEDRNFIMGVKVYDGLRESKTVRFDKSGGININNGVPSGFVPSEFIIEEIDVFGAAYHSNQWRGIRFTK